MKYSLASYILTITLPESIRNKLKVNEIQIGGSGSYLDSIKLNFNGQLWSVKGDATGSWIHEKNLDRSGTADITLSQLSDAVSKFIKICNFMYTSQNDDVNGCTLTLSTLNSRKIAVCNDCMISKIPPQEFGSTATDQTWTFECGQIIPVNDD